MLGKASHMTKHNINWYGSMLCQQWEWERNEYLLNNKSKLSKDLSKKENSIELISAEMSCKEIFERYPSDLGT